MDLLPHQNRHGVKSEFSVLHYDRQLLHYDRQLFGLKSTTLINRT